MLSEVTFSALTDVGRKREHNEDNYLVDNKLGLYVVCDGMGGHAAGEVASALAVRVFHEEVKREEEMLADFAAGKSGGAKVSARDISNMMEFAANRASARVYAEAATDESRRGMGTTLVATLLCGNQLFVTWVGDSRLYLLREGVLEQVTEDHNVFNELVKRRKMPREKVEKLAQKNAVTRAIGVYEHAEPESLSFDLLNGDRLLLCSDGLYQYFEEDLDKLSARMALMDLDQATRLLVDGANELGGSDNITGVLIALGSGDARDEERARKLQLKREILAKMRLFRALSDRELLRVLQVTDVAQYEPEQIVMEQGMPGEELYIVLEGAVKVCRGDTVIALLEQGSHVGEMALVRNQPRSATVKSAGPSELMVIRRRDFFELLRTEHSLAVKLLWQFLGVVADRLAETSRELGQAREELLVEDLTDQLFEEDMPVDDDDLDNRPTLAVPRPSDRPETMEPESWASEPEAAPVPSRRDPKGPGEREPKASLTPPPPSMRIRTATPESTQVAPPPATPAEAASEISTSAAELKDARLSVSNPPQVSSSAPPPSSAPMSLRPLGASGRPSVPRLPRKSSPSHPVPSGATPSASPAASPGANPPANPSSDDPKEPKKSDDE
jgi:PPM family protein phosphatase